MSSIILSSIFHFVYNNKSELLNVLLATLYLCRVDCIPETTYLVRDFICDDDSPVLINIKEGYYSVNIEYSGVNNYHSVYFISTLEDNMDVKHVLGDKEKISFVIENGKIFLKCQEFILGTMIITKI
jgi:hypothetical protein